MTNITNRQIHRAMQSVVLTGDVGTQSAELRLQSILQSRTAAKVVNGPEKSYTYAMNIERVEAQLHHRQVEVEELSIHVVEGGIGNGPAVLFLHGWPENWESFEAVMIPLAAEAHVVAIDLPGIGESRTSPRSKDKRTLAKYVGALIQKLQLQNLTLVGHDVGGQIVYSYLHAFPNTLQRAVMMNIVVPGVEPWSE